MDLFKRINNAVLDLQATDLQGYERPLLELTRLLEHPDLAAANAALTDGLDLDAFLTESEATQGGMVGSARLLWPPEREKQLGLILLLMQRWAKNPHGIIDFGHTFFYGGSKIVTNIHSVVRQVIIPFQRDYKAFVEARGAPMPGLVQTTSDKVFVVHGHDEGAREMVARFLERLGLVAVILHEQANQGRTVIEKVEAHGDVAFAVVILTPDDEGRTKGAADLRPRARQNVLLELGYFIGRLGRASVCALKRDDPELPTDFAGVVWTAMDDGGWRMDLARELKAAGFNVDLNKAV